MSGGFESQIHTKTFFGYVQCCGSGMFFPDPGSEFFLSRIQGQKDSRIRIRIEEFTLSQKIVSKLLEIWSKNIHPGSWFCNSSRMQGSKKASDPGSGSATLVTCPGSLLIISTSILLSFRKSITYRTNNTLCLTHTNNLANVKISHCHQAKKQEVPVGVLRLLPPSIYLSLNENYSLQQHVKELIMLLFTTWRL